MLTYPTLEFYSTRLNGILDAPPTRLTVEAYAPSFIAPSNYCELLPHTMVLDFVVVKPQCTKLRDGSQTRTLVDITSMQLSIRPCRPSQNGVAPVTTY